MIGLIGKKLGMTRVVTEGGITPVSVIAVGGNRLAQVKTKDVDGYDAIQLAMGEKKVKRLSSPQKGHLAKYKVGAADKLKECFGCIPKEGEQSGDEINMTTVFVEGQVVDVSGVSKGKGFAGVIKRHNFSSNRATHGNSRAHRKPGSTGQCQDPGRTFPGKKMPGRLGGKKKTTQNLSVMRLDVERQLLLVKGAIPGAPGTYVFVRPAVKKRG